MKKMLAFVGILLATIFVISLNQVSGEDMTTTTLITTTTVSETQTNTGTMVIDGNYYYYTGYQDLINQIYADIYDDVYAQIYDEVIDELTDAYYDELYQEVQAKLETLLSEDEFALYVDDFQQDIYAIKDIAERSVLGITSYYLDGGSGVGSGVIYKVDQSTNTYYLITNHHVIDGADSLEVRFEDETTVTPTVLGYDTEVDVAVLTFQADSSKNLIVSTLGDSDTLEVSELVFAVGNPIGYNFWNSMTMGIVSGLEREVDANRYIDYIQHDAAINGGNSGGPIYNIDGEVVGINVSKLANIEIEGMGFALPINLVKDIVERIENGDLEANTIMPRLGSSYYVVQDVIEDEGMFLPVLFVNGSDKYNITVELPVGVTEGLVLFEFDNNGTLANRLKPGDLIVAINSYHITDEISFQDYFYETYEAGDFVTIYYYEFDQANYNYIQSMTSISVRLK